MAKVGLIAGSGRFPLLFAEEARRMNVDVLALGIRDVTDPALEKLASEVRYFKLGELEKPIRTFKEAGVTQVVMAGKVQHASLFGGVMPDFRAVKLFARLKDRRTDTILRAVADEFAKDGIELLSSATYLSHLLVEEGVHTKRAPSKQEAADMALGWQAAKALAGLDVGQTVVVQEGAVVALEGMEGTDACIERAAELARSRGNKPSLTVVKVAKPRQDVRFDIPVIGLDTLKTFERCDARALALEAGSTLVFDREEFFREADRLKLAVRAFPKEGPR